MWWETAWVLFGSMQNRLTELWWDYNTWQYLYQQTAGRSEAQPLQWDLSSLFWYSIAWWSWSSQMIPLPWFLLQLNFWDLVSLFRPHGVGIFSLVLRLPLHPFPNFRIKKNSLKHYLTLSVPPYMCWFLNKQYDIVLCVEDIFWLQTWLKLHTKKA